MRALQSGQAQGLGEKIDRHRGMKKAIVELARGWQ